MLPANSLKTRDIPAEEIGILNESIEIEKPSVLTATRDASEVKWATFSIVALDAISVLLVSSTSAKK